MAANHGPCETDLVGSTERILHDRLGLAEVADFDTAHR
jgi:hypothetical protein